MEKAGTAVKPLSLLFGLFGAEKALLSPGAVKNPPAWG